MALFVYYTFNHMLSNKKAKKNLRLMDSNTIIDLLRQRNTFGGMFRIFTFVNFFFFCGSSLQVCCFL